MKIRFKAGSTPGMVYFVPVAMVYRNPLRDRWFDDFAFEAAFLRWAVALRFTRKDDDL